MTIRGNDFTPLLLKLVSAQAVYYLIVSIDLTLTALAGLRLAPTPALATLPLSLIIVVGTVCSFAAGNAAAKFGYRNVMVVGAVLAVAGGFLAAIAVLNGSFVLFCLATAVTGAYRSTGGFLRFIASEYAPKHRRESSLAAVLYGGIIAAAVGPFAAIFASGLTTTPFVGSCILTGLLGVAALLLALMLPRGHPGGVKDQRAIGISERWRNQPFWQAVVILMVSGSAMTLVMAAGPLANQHAGHGTEAGALMIQLHLVGMFAPSAASAWILKKWGAIPSSLLGTLTMGVGCVLAFTGSSEWSMVLTLLAVGIGWNILFVSGSALLLESYPQGRGAKIQGFAEGVTAGFSALASFVAAELLDVISWTGLNLVALMALTAMALVIFLTRKRAERQPLIPRLFNNLLP